MIVPLLSSMMNGLAVAAPPDPPDPPPADVDLFSTTTMDNDRYTAFPAADTYTNIPMLVAKDSTSHAAEGPAMITKFVSGAWTTKVQMRIDGVLQEIATLGIGVHGTRVCFAYQPSYNALDPYPFISYAYNDDGSRDFISSGNVNKRTGETFVSGFGKIIKMPSGKLRYPVYAADATDSFLYFHESTDNGISWHVGADIYSCLSDTTGMSVTDIITGGVGSLSELYVAIVQAGGSDATTKMVCCVRNDSLYGGGAHYHFSSDDGGATWSYHGLVTADRLGSNGGNPMTVHVRAPNIYFISGQREATTNGSLGYNFNICVLKGTALTAYNNPAALSAKRFLAKGIAGYKAAGADFGYPEIFNQDSVDWICFYDHSTKSMGGGDTLKRIRIVIIPLEPAPYLEMINTADQSIAASTPTNVAMSFTQLDSQGIYGGTFVIPQDGVYIPRVRGLFTANATGTFRTLRIKCTAKSYESSRTIVPSSDTKFCWIDHAGIPYFFQEGDVIVFEAEHDATSSLNLLNTGLHTNAMITLCKIHGALS